MGFEGKSQGRLILNMRDRKEVVKEESERQGDNPVSWNPAKGQVSDQMHAVERARVCVKVVTAILKEKSNRRVVQLKAALLRVEKELQLKNSSRPTAHPSYSENFKLSDAVVLLGYIHDILYQ